MHVKQAMIWAKDGRTALRAWHTWKSLSVISAWFHRKSPWSVGIMCILFMNYEHAMCVTAELTVQTHLRSFKHFFLHWYLHSNKLPLLFECKCLCCFFALEFAQPCVASSFHYIFKVGRQQRRSINDWFSNAPIHRRQKEMVQNKTKEIWP